MRKVIQRRSEQAWRELVARQSQSGLSVQAFCRREGLNPWTLYGWRSRLGARGTSEEPVVSGAAEAEPTAWFIDLGGLAGSSSPRGIRVDLGGGVLLHVVRS